jgi:uncharacterized membrane protein
MNTLLIMYIVSGTLLALLAVPLWLKKIKPNPIYGVRLPKTYSDPDIWYATNAYAARYLVLAGLSMVTGALLLYFVPGLSVDAYALACLAVFVVAFGFGVFQILRFLKRQ